MSLTPSPFRADTMNTREGRGKPACLNLKVVTQIHDTRMVFKQFGDCKGGLVSRPVLGVEGLVSRPVLGLCGGVRKRPVLGCVYV